MRSARSTPGNPPLAPSRRMARGRHERVGMIPSPGGGGDADYLARIRAHHVARARRRRPDARRCALRRTCRFLCTGLRPVSIPWSDVAPTCFREAMTAGVRSVVCDLPSLPEWVADGETGYRVDRLDRGWVVALVAQPEQPSLHAHARQSHTLSSLTEPAVPSQGSHGNPLSSVRALSAYSLWPSKTRARGATAGVRRQRR